MAREKNDFFEGKRPTTFACCILCVEGQFIENNRSGLLHNIELHVRFWSVHKLSARILSTCSPRSLYAGHIIDSFLFLSFLSSVSTFYRSRLCIALIAIKFVLSFIASMHAVIPIQRHDWLSTCMTVGNSVCFCLNAAVSVDVKVADELFYAYATSFSRDISLALFSSAMAGWLAGWLAGCMHALEQVRVVVC
jgi:hypothetical protein